MSVALIAVAVLAIALVVFAVEWHHAAGGRRMMQRLHDTEGDG